MPILRTATATLASASIFFAPLTAAAQSVPTRLPSPAVKEAESRLPQIQGPRVDTKTRAAEVERARLDEARAQAPIRPQVPRAQPQAQQRQQPQQQRPAPPAGPTGQTTQAQQAAPGVNASGRNAEEQAQVRTQARRRGRFQLDFDEAEIKDVVQTISDFTGKLFIVPENIRGKITIVGPEDGTGLVTADEAYTAFISALEANNWTVYPVGQYLKLVEKRAAPNSHVWTYTDPDSAVPADERMVTKVLRLRYINTDTLANPLKQLASKDASIIPIPPDTLIVTEVGLNLRRIERIIQSLDKPGGGDELRILNVEFANAQELADKLLQIFDAQGGGGAATPAPRRGPRRAAAQPAAAAEQADGEGGGVSITRVIADERTNKLIIIASSRAFEQIEDLVRQLDIPTGDTGRINVYYLANANAEELATTLQNLTGGTTGAQPQPTRGRRAAPEAAQGTAELFAGEVKISADNATNSLVVVASQQDYKSLVRVIEKLDIPRRQVFVEAVIMEVNLNNTDSFGISFHGGGAVDTDDGIAPIVVGNQLGSASSLNLSSLVSMGGFLAGMQGPNVPGVAELGVALPSFGVVMHALTRDSDVNVLSTPHILTSDNEEAEITVGQNVPFQAGYAPSGLSNLLGGAGGATGAGNLLGSTALLGGLGNLYAPIQRQNVELKLKIKPQINESDYIRMEVEEQTEEIAQQDPQLGPTTAKRTAKTVIVAKDQTTVVIGGLIQERTINSVQKTPILGDIPVIGRLFRDTETQRLKTNLLLFLTPYIIRDQSDFQRIFERKMREREQFIAAFYGIADDYEVPIEYERKAGPFALLAKDVRNEMMRVENGGPGLEGENVVAPRQQQEMRFVPRGSNEDEEASGTFEGPGVEAPAAPAAEDQNVGDAPAEVPAEEGL